MNVISKNYKFIICHVSPVVKLEFAQQKKLLYMLALLLISQKGASTDNIQHNLTMNTQLWQSMQHSGHWRRASCIYLLFTQSLRSEVLC